MADWKDIAGTVGRAAPLLGSLLGGPAGGAVGALISSALGTPAGDAQAAAAALADPASALKLREIETTHAERIQALAVQVEQMRLGAEAQAMQAQQAAAADVGATMRVEAAAEHWPTYSWRPAIGFAVALAVLLSVLTVFAGYGAALAGHAEGLAQLPGVLAAVAGIIGVVSPILGIASWYRGRMQADPTVPTINRG